MTINSIFEMLYQNSYFLHELNIIDRQSKNEALILHINNSRGDLSFSCL